MVESCLVAAACCNCRRVCECVRMRGTPLSARACVRPLVLLTRGAGIRCFVCSKRGVVEWAAMGLCVSVPGVAWVRLSSFVMACMQSQHVPACVCVCVYASVVRVCVRALKA